MLTPYLYLFFRLFSSFTKPLAVLEHRKAGGRGQGHRKGALKWKEIALESRVDIPACLSQCCFRDNPDFKDFTRNITDIINVQD